MEFNVENVERNQLPEIETKKLLSGVTNEVYNLRKVQDRVYSNPMAKETPMSGNVCDTVTYRWRG